MCFRRSNKWISSETITAHSAHRYEFVTHIIDRYNFYKQNIAFYQFHWVASSPIKIVYCVSCCCWTICVLNIFSWLSETSETIFLLIFFEVVQWFESYNKMECILTMTTKIQLNGNLMFKPVAFSTQKICCSNYSWQLVYGGKKIGCDENKRTIYRLEGTIRFIRELRRHHTTHTNIFPQREREICSRKKWQLVKLCANWKAVKSGLICMESE